MSKGAIAAPVLEPIISHDIPLAVSREGIQRAMVPEPVGKAPASPAPNKKRVIINVANPVVAPVKAVNKDHIITIRIKTFFCPILSAIAPEGISNKAYDK